MPLSITTYRIIIVSQYRLKDQTKLKRNTDYYNKNFVGHFKGRRFYMYFSSSDVVPLLISLSLQKLRYTDREKNNRCCVMSCKRRHRLRWSVLVALIPMGKTLFLFMGWGISRSG